MRAGKLTAGSEQTIRMIRREAAELVIIASDASDGTKKKVTDKCTYYEADYIVAGEKAKLGHSIGKGEKTVLAVMDAGFKSKLIELAGLLNNP